MATTTNYSVEVNLQFSQISMKLMSHFQLSMQYINQNYIFFSYFTKDRTIGTISDQNIITI